MKKILNWMEKHPAISIGIIGGCSLLTGCLIGRRMFMEKLIRYSEKDEVYYTESINHIKNGHLIYEIKAECIGD